MQRNDKQACNFDKKSFNAIYCVCVLEFYWMWLWSVCFFFLQYGVRLEEAPAGQQKGRKVSIYGFVSSAGCWIHTQMVRISFTIKLIKQQQIIEDFNCSIQLFYNFHSRMKRSFKFFIDENKSELCWSFRDVSQFLYQPYKLICQVSQQFHIPM